MSKHTLQYKLDMSGTYTFRLVDGHSIANAGVGTDWLTIYLIETDPGYRNQGEATRLLEELKQMCKSTGRDMAMWCPMNQIAEHLCKKLNLKIVGVEARQPG